MSDQNKMGWATVGRIIVLFAAVSAAHGFGYWQGIRHSQERAIIAGATYATTACVAQEIVSLRQMTRLIEAKNRKPIVVECRP